MRTITIRQFCFAVMALCLSAWASANTYSYDSLNRLIAVSFDGGGGLTYAYDPAGNLLSVVPTGDTGYALNVSLAGNGGGVVAGGGSSINCGTTCSASFASGTSVTLTATPATGSTFSGWSGACTGTGSCAISMTAAKSVTATFTLDTAKPVCTLSASPASITAASTSTLTASCTPAATSYTWTGGSCAGTTGTTCTVSLTSTTTYTVTGTNAAGTGAAASATVTIASAGAPVCTLSANPASITAGGSSTLTATCNPAATGYIWTGGTCAGTSGPSCTVSPAVTTTYSVVGSNAGGTNSAASATVSVVNNVTAYTVPGTLGNDVFVLTAGNSYLGGGGNDTYIISPYTLRGDVTAKIIDTEGDNLIQLVDGMTVTSSAFYSDAAQLTLSTGAKVQILGASKFKFQVGANAPAGDTAAILTYTEFVTGLGASLSSGTLPASGTAGYVVPTGFTQAAAPVPTVAGPAYTVCQRPDDCLQQLLQQRRTAHALQRCYCANPGSLQL